MMYDSDLKLRIGQVAKGAAKNLRKRSFWDIWVFATLPFCHFEVPVMLPFSKSFGHPPLIEPSETDQKARLGRVTTKRGERVTNCQF